MQPTVEYLGYRIDAQGIHAIEKKLEAIRKAPASIIQHQLRSSFLAMMNCYLKFICNYSTISHPLNELLKDRVEGKSERNYAQIEKEALSIIFGMKKFHQYLCGIRFLLVTDHKRLTTLLGPKSGILTLEAARLQRWALLLAAYQYDIE